MKVVCIDDNCICDDNVVLLRKGNIYTVIDSAPVEKHTSKGKRVVSGVYLKLIETGHWYHESLFIQINENQQDEEEIAEKREQQYIQ